MTEQACEPCNHGTYSLGGGVRFEHFDEAEWPRAQGVIISTFCSPPGVFERNDTFSAEHPDCVGWLRNGAYTESGHTEVNVNTVLQFDFVTHEAPGRFQFKYAADTDGFGNNLYVQIDGEAAIRIANSAEYKTLSVNLQPGSHTVRFAYFKQVNPVCRVFVSASRMPTLCNRQILQMLTKMEMPKLTWTWLALISLKSKE